MRKWLREIRKQKKLTQNEVAKMSGISGNYYSCIETGERGNPLPVSTAKRIAKSLNFDWQQFYDEGKTKTPPKGSV